MIQIPSFWRNTAGQLLPLLITLAGALILSSGVVLLLVEDPETTLFYLLLGPVLNPAALGNLLDRTALLTLTGLGFALAYRGGSMNLGGEGQALAGGLAAAAAALWLPGLPRGGALALALLAGTGMGVIWGGIPGILRARWGVSEPISTFLLTGVMIPVGDVLLGGPMKDPQSYLIAAPPLPQAFRLVPWMPPSRLNVSLVWALLGAAGGALFLSATRWGYEWRIRGAQEEFARYGGIRVGRIAAASLAVSGGLHGLAGTAALLGSYGQGIQGFTASLGWGGLAVALIARNHPLLVPPAALIYAWLSLGTHAAMIHTGFPFALGGLVQAAVFLFVSARFSFTKPAYRRELS